MSVIAWGTKVTDTFLERAKWIVDDLQIGDDSVDGTNKLMACMGWESGRTFSSSVSNQAGSGATGLIQFMPTTAVHLGTTTTRLAMMTAEDQLNYVWKYFEPYRGKLKTLADLYMAILWPSAVGKPESAVLWSKADMPTTFRQNAGLDTDKDGVITKAEAAGKVTAMLIEGMKPENSRDYTFEVVNSHAIPDAPVVEEPKVETTVKAANEVINETPVAPASVQYETEGSVVTTTVEPNNIGTTISHAVGGWQGNLAGMAVIVGTLLSNPDFTAKLSVFLLSLGKGGADWGAVAVMIGAALIAYKARPTNSNP